MNPLLSGQSAVTASLRRPDQLDATDRDQMLVLMHQYYHNLDRAIFLNDLDAEDWVIQLRVRQTGRLVGFSTQRLLRAEVEGNPVRAIFSGDTIVQREFWQSPTLAQAWGRFAISTIDQEAATPLYWLLLSKGYRTYRFLPLFFHEYAPALEIAERSDLQRIRETFMHALYGSAFDSRTATINGAAIGNYSLREGVGDVDESRRKDPRIRFFVTRNPGYQQGDELCCIAPLSRDNFTPAARRVIGAMYFGTVSCKPV